MRFRGRMFLLLVLAAIALLSPVGRLLSLYTDWLWFREVQFTSVFVTVLRTEVLLGVVTGAPFFVILYSNVTLARWLAFSQRGVTFGAGYADVNAQFPVLKALMVLASLVPSCA